MDTVVRPFEVTHKVRISGTDVIFQWKRFKALDALSFAISD